MKVWAVLYLQEDGTLQVSVHDSAEAAGMEAAAWLGNTDGNVDGYVPEMVNAAREGDTDEFISEDEIWRVRVFPDTIPDPRCKP